MADPANCENHVKQPNSLDDSSYQPQKRHQQQAHHMFIPANASTGPVLQRIPARPNPDVNQPQQQQLLELRPPLSFSTTSVADLDNASLVGGSSMPNESFSFNSYQDILCSGFERSSSTFLASDIQRTLKLQQQRAVSGLQEQQRIHELHPKELHRQKQQQQQQQPPHQTNRSTLNPKFRVHSRQKSVECQNLQFHPKQLDAVENRSQICQQQQRTINSFANVRSNNKEQQLEANRSRWDERGTEKSEATIKRKKINYQQQDYELSLVRQEQEQLKSHKVQKHNKNNKTMSHSALQSIQTLSLQLNQQVNLRAASSSLSELSLTSGHSAHGQQQLSIANNLGAQNKDLSSGGKLTRLVGKKAARVKEMLLQNLGKADKTTDELFQMYEENFYKQQAHAIKLQKEFKQYVGALKIAQVSSKSLNVCIQQSTSDYQSARHDLVCENLNQLEHLNEDLLEKLRTQILVSMSEYLAQFDELKEKIAKRRRKLIDHDSSRRIYEVVLAAVTKKRQQATILRQQQQNNSAQLNPNQPPSRSFRSAFKLGSQAVASDSIQSATNQLVDEARLLKLREQYNYCKIMFETINRQLYEQLPMLYEKKMKHLLMSLQTYFSLEAQFHSNAGKLFATAADVIDELPSMSLTSSSSFSTDHSHGQQMRNHQLAGRESVGTGSVEEEDDEDDDEHEEEEQEENGRLNHGEEEEEEHYDGKNNVEISGASSGVGSSRCGDSTLESSSASPAAEVEETSSCDHVEDQDEEHQGKGSPSEASMVNKDKSSSLIGAGKLEESIGCGEQLVGVGGLSSSKSIEVVVPDIGSNVISVRDEQFENEISQVAQKIVDEVVVHSLPDIIQGGQRPAEIKKIEINSDKDTKESGIVEEKLNLREQLPTSSNGRYLYKVRTTYKYLAEDVDELCFEADEIIQVIEFEPTQEQEEGWLMGIREVNGQRGLFPANFTQTI